MKFKYLLLLILIFSCKKEEFSFKNLSYNEKLIFLSKKTSVDSVLTNDQKFVKEKLLSSKYRVNLKLYDTIKKGFCLPDRISKKQMILSFEGIKNIGDIDNDNKDDFVFVLPSVNCCEEGDSYYFTNDTIPRIETDSGCCHPYSIFSIGDIDEDGSNEIAEYYSSCLSNFKSIRIWTLKKNKWLLVKRFSYFFNDEYKAFEDFDKLYKKISKNKFEFLEISDRTLKGKLVKKWVTVTMN